jgi:secondary thiamine-phosphate synthase enzyme
MNVETHRLHIPTKGNSHMVDLTPQIVERLARGVIQHGTATIFVVGSTAAITTIEFEPGLAEVDFPAALERIAPREGRYAHEEAWHDDNGCSHVRASLMGPSLTVPLLAGVMPLGTWQQIVLVDFDTRPRRREIVLQVVGE